MLGGVLARLETHLIDLVLPRRCLGCQAAGAGLCSACRQVRPSVRFVPGLGMVHAAATYRGAVGTAVVHFKDRGRRDLLGPLASLLGQAIQRCETADFAASAVRTLVVPVPSTRRAARDRGGDHMCRLARRAARLLGLDWAPLLSVSGDVADAAGLNARQRRRNVAGAFAVGRAWAGGPVAVLLVDDVITTGSTLLEATRTLTDAGFLVGGAAVIAATAR